MEKIYLSDAGPKVSPAIYGFWRWEDNAEHSEEAAELSITEADKSHFKIFVKHHN